MQGLHFHKGATDPSLVGQGGCGLAMESGWSRTVSVKGFAPAVEWILRSVREWFMGAAMRFPVAGSCSAQRSDRNSSWLMASVDIEPC